MKKHRIHQEWILGFCAAVFVAVIVGFVAWVITATAKNLNYAAAPAKPEESSNYFDLDGAGRLKLRNVPEKIE